MLRGTTPFEQFPSRGLPESGLWDLGFRGSGGFRVKGAPTFLSCFGIFVKEDNIKPRASAWQL